MSAVEGERRGVSVRGMLCFSARTDLSALSFTTFPDSDMGRCNICHTCLDVAAYRKNNSGKRNSKKVKRYEKANKCSNPTSNAKRRKVSELQSLHTAGHGGQIRGEVFDAPSVANTTNRAARPKCSLKEPSTFKSEDFEQYCALVLKCTTVAKESDSSNVKAESRSMLSKMRKLMDPTVKGDVDFAEATMDCSNILRHWINGDAAGTAAFIPDLEDRDICYAALKIFSCAAEEAKLIPQEYVEMFGEDDGIGIYNGLIELIGEREKQCLPLVNMCLRAWMEKLTVDMDLWADLSPLDFDQWLEDAMTAANVRDHIGKSSYEMMMAIFGEKSTNSTSTCASTPPARDTKKQGISLEPHVRISKVQKIGQVMREALIRSSLLRSKYHTAEKADERIRRAVRVATEGDLNNNSLRRCREAAQKMDEILFSVGGAERLVATLRYFKEQPAVRELVRAKEILMSEGATPAKSDRYLSKDENLSALIVDGLKGFVGMFHRKRGDGDKGGGRRSTEDQNVYDAVMAALASGDLTSAKLGTMLCRKLDISRRQIKRGRAIRKNMEDMDTKRWIRKSSAVPKSAIADGEFECSR